MTSPKNSHIDMLTPADVGQDGQPAVQGEGSVSFQRVSPEHGAAVLGAILNGGHNLDTVPAADMDAQLETITASTDKVPGAVFTVRRVGGGDFIPAPIPRHYKRQNPFSS